MDYLIGEPSYLRRGVAQAALANLTKCIAAEPDAKRIIVQPDANNVASRGLLQACGFSYDEVNDLFVLDLHLA